jgi:hypothetical protein
MRNDKPCINPIESQREEALRHYRELADKCHHWSSFVEHAIKAYNPNAYIESNLLATPLKNNLEASDNNNSNNCCDAPFNDSNSVEQVRKGTINYGGSKNNVIHEVIDDSTNEVFKVCRESVLEASNRMAERQMEMKRGGYKGPFALPHNCFRHRQPVDFNVINNEAKIIFQ